LPRTAIQDLRALRECRPQGQDEDWTSVAVSLERSGAYRFEYGYGVPSFAAQRMKQDH
jgi:hypothetical protein